VLPKINPKRISLTVKGKEYKSPQDLLTRNKREYNIFMKLEDKSFLEKVELEFKQMEYSSRALQYKKLKLSLIKIPSSKEEE